MRSSRPFVTIVIILSFGALLGAGVAGTASAQSQRISINKTRMQIVDLVKRVGEATGRTIIHDERVRGAISVVAKRSVTLEEAWSILDASLMMLGFSLLPSTEGNWRISPVAQAVGEAPFVDRVSADREAFVTSLIPLRVADPQTVLRTLQTLSGARVTMVALEDTNSIIASGPERRIARLVTIADALDKTETYAVRSRLLRYRQVAEVEPWVDAMFAAGTLKTRELEVWSDVRTNSLIYRGSDDQTALLLDLVAGFDRPSSGEGALRILKVLHRDPEEVAELLRGFRQSGDQTRAQIPEAGQALTTLATSDYSIAVDKGSRSLVVRASADAHEALRKALELLDEPAQMIAIDVKVSEVRTPRAFALDFAFSIPLSSGDEQGELIARMVSTPGGGGLAAAASAADTALFGRIDQDLNVPFTVDDGTGIAIPITNSAAIIASEAKIYTEILIEPSLVVTAGEPQEIFVGNNVPVPVAAEGGGTQIEEGTGAPVLTNETRIERQDIGIKLGLTAIAGKRGEIQVDLDLDLSRIAPSTAGAIEVVGPTFIHQEIQATARLDDGEIAIIAVYKDRQKVELVAGTPFLSSLPFIGWLFTQTIEQDEDTHLFVTVQARRVGSPSELAADSIRRRLAFDRRNAQGSGLPTVAPNEPAYAVLVTTRKREDDAEAITSSFALRGFAAETHSWEFEGESLFDVYITGFPTLSDAAEVATELSAEGWQADLTFRRTRS